MPQPPVPPQARLAGPEETALIPRAAFYETALIPAAREAKRDAPPSLAELASRHGLRPAATRPSLGAYVADLWRFREFITTYANGRSVASFGEAKLGRLWQVLTPLANAAVYFLIFGVILDTRRQVDNFIGYLCIGLFIFQFTTQVVSTAAAAISGQQGLVRALQFPRASLPIAMTITQIEGLIASMVVLCGIMVATGEPVSLRWVFLIPALALQLVFNLGLALIIARIGAKVPDIRQVLPFVLRAWMYASGVLYSVDIFTDNLPGWAAAIVQANPLLVYIETARYALMENPPLASSIGEMWLLGAAWAGATLIVGFLYFWRGETEYGRG